MKKKVVKKEVKRGRPVGSKNKVKKVTELGSDNMVSLAIRMVDISNSLQATKTDVTMMSENISTLAQEFCKSNNQNAKQLIKALERIDALEKMVTDLKDKSPEQATMPKEVM